MKYMQFWRNKFLTMEAGTIDDMIQDLESAVKKLKEMRDDGIVLEGGAGDDYARLVTKDPEVAEKYDFPEERLEWIFNKILVINSKDR